MFDLVISNGSVVTEEGVLRLDVAVSGEIVVELAPRIAGEARRRVDATGLLVLPGLVDPHVHLDLPMKGTVSSDDAGSGTAAALHGGVTTIVDFTVPGPGQTLAASVQERRLRFDGRTYADYALHANVTDFAWAWGPSAPAVPPPGCGGEAGLDGEIFEACIRRQLEEVSACGVASLKVFTCYSREGIAIPPPHLLALLRASRDAGMLVLVHAEDDALLTASEDALRRRGREDAAAHPLARPEEAEERAIRAVIEAASETGAPVYFVHVSTAAGARAIVEGRHSHAPGKPGPIHFETCPHYLLLDDSAYQGEEAAEYLVAPPLRKPADREALWRALSAGEVDVVATDHCPFRRAQKPARLPCYEIPNGLPGVETRLVLLHTFGILAGRMGWPDLVRVCAGSPARLMGLSPRKGGLRPGGDADIVLFDPEPEWSLSARRLHMNTDFSPYEGRSVRGRVHTVILRGEVALDGEGPGPRRGRYLPARIERPGR